MRQRSEININKLKTLLSQKEERLEKSKKPYNLVINDSHTPNAQAGSPSLWRFYFNVHPEYIDQALITICELLKHQDAPQISIGCAVRSNDKKVPYKRGIYLSFYPEELQSPEKAFEFLKSIANKFRELGIQKDNLREKPANERFVYADMPETNDYISYGVEGVTIVDDEMPASAETFTIKQSIYESYPRDKKHNPFGIKGDLLKARENFVIPAAPIFGNLLAEPLDSSEEQAPEYELNAVLENHLSVDVVPEVYSAPQQAPLVLESASEPEEQSELMSQQHADASSLLNPLILHPNKRNISAWKILIAIFPMLGMLTGGLLTQFNVISASSIIFGSTLGLYALPISLMLGGTIGLGMSLMLGGCVLLTKQSSLSKRIGGVFLTTLGAVGIGATIGSILFPGIGTFIGASIGLFCGLVVSAIINKCGTSPRDERGIAQSVPIAPSPQPDEPSSTCRAHLGLGVTPRASIDENLDPHASSRPLFIPVTADSVPILSSGISMTSS